VIGRSGGLDELLRISSASLLAAPPRLPPSLLHDVRAGELLKLLQARNGFYAFESALHLLPAGDLDDLMNLAKWNTDTLWRHEYGDLAKGCLFFAEDIFGNQFCIRDGEIDSFEAETGAARFFASNLAGWADRVLADHDLTTGFPVAHEWQTIHGPVAPGRRLIPKIPFVTGGDFSVRNLYDADAVEGMRFRGYLARKIHDLPDGSQIEFKITP
jgi:hypothetical protein